MHGKNLRDQAAPSPLHIRRKFVWGNRPGNRWEARAHEQQKQRMQKSCNTPDSTTATAAACPQSERVPHCEGQLQGQSNKDPAKLLRKWQEAINGVLNMDKAPPESAFGKKTPMHQSHASSHSSSPQNSCHTDAPSPAPKTLPTRDEDHSRGPPGTPKPYTAPSHLSTAVQSALSPRSSPSVFFDASQNVNPVPTTPGPPPIRPRAAGASSHSQRELDVDVHAPTAEPKEPFPSSRNTLAYTTSFRPAKRPQTRHELAQQNPATASHTESRMERHVGASGQSQCRKQRRHHGRRCLAVHPGDMGGRAQSQMHAAHAELDTSGTASHGSRQHAAVATHDMHDYYYIDNRDPVRSASPVSSIVKPEVVELPLKPQLGAHPVAIGPSAVGGTADAGGPHNSANCVNLMHACVNDAAHPSTHGRCRNARALMHGNNAHARWSNRGSHYE
jgi:hypothetical protein